MVTLLQRWFLIAKIIFHNVHSADFTRLEEFSKNTVNIDIVISIGTGKTASADAEFTQCQLPRHKAGQIGWRKGRITNRSRGLAIPYGEKLHGTASSIQAPLMS